MNAALSAIAGLYLLCTAAAAAGQTPDPPPLGSHVTVAPLADLPSSADLFSLLDATIPEAIADRIDTGGLSTGDPARIGAHGSSWTQTRFRIGDIDVTDPSGAGTPLLLPQIDAWDRVEVMTGLMPVDESAPGLAIRLTPRRPADAWRYEIAIEGSIPALLAGTPDANPPAIARLHSWLDADVLASGPIVPGRVGLFWTTNATASSRFEGASTDQLDATLVSSFAHVEIARAPADALSIVGWAQRARYPFADRLAFAQPFARERTLGAHAQAAWNRHGDARGWSSSVFGGLTVGDRTNDLVPSSSLVMERLRDGPVPELLNPGTGGARTLMAGARLALPLDAGGTRQQITVGGEIASAHATQRAAFSGLVGETIDGLPAHVWQFADSGVDSSWSRRAVTAYVADRIAAHPRITLDGALRFEHVAGANTSGPTAVSWNDMLPRASVRWAMLDVAHLTAFGGFGRYAHQLPLSDLAWGDRSAPSGAMHLWTGGGTRPPTASDVGALVARVGPGTAGDPSFTAIDPALRRPHMDELVTGFEAWPTAASLVRLSAIGRRERNLIGAVDVGVPESAYTVSFLPDAGVDLVGSADDQLLPIYNRPRSTFGADRYLLTNPPDDEATFVGADLTYQAQTEHLFLLMGATAGRSEGLSANRGFTAIENDDAVIGEVFADPNARTYAQGRLFTERGYTLKWSGAYRFPQDATVGIVARYQDGQHFARLVIVPDLNQGPEAVRAFRNGRTRFTYTLTIDMRLQKHFTIDGRRVTGLVDVFNVLNKAKEVEEFPVTGASSRLTAAVQPPRAIHLGLRVAF